MAFEHALDGDHPRRALCAAARVPRGGAAAATGLVFSAAGCKGKAGAPKPPEVPPSAPVLPGVVPGPFGTGEPQTPYADITSYNNFYEFGTDKGDPAANAHTLVTRPWTVAFEGEIAKPQTIDVDTLLKLFPLEERVYRLRCVEAWSMVIPWVGFPLGPLIKRLEPTSPREVRRVRDQAGPDRDAGPADRRARLAVRRGAAPRRGDAPADDPGGRALWPGAAQSERRAGAAGGAVEVRLQEHQVDRAGPLRRAAAADHLEPPGARASTASIRT